MTREQERAELHKTLWNIAEDLRGQVGDGWTFKNYVLGMMFYRFISENITNYINKEEHAAGNTTFNYADLSDEDAAFGKEVVVKAKGLYILPSHLFENVRKNANLENLNEVLSEAFRTIENSAKGTDSERDLSGLFADIDVNHNVLGNTVQARNGVLLKVMNAVAGFRLNNLQGAQNDTFGDAYEFLMTMYASRAGKSGGEFFTPQEVSELLARLTTVGKQRVSRVYDPCCGSGSLLLKFAKILGKENVQGFFGQEINLTTYNLCRINMFLHDIEFKNFDIALGDTLLEPSHWDEQPFECIVSNPPYSIKWEGDNKADLINDPRFAPAGVLAPKSKADLAFTMHMLQWLSTTGTAAIVEFPGVLYRGGAEQKIRQYLVDNNYVDTVIQLPQNLFFGTSIATCIIVLKKNKRDNNILFIDATNEFIHEGDKNKLSDANISRVLDSFVAREMIEHFTALVPHQTIADNGYNLSVSSYVEAEDTREEINIDELNARLAEIVAHEEQLRREIDELIKNNL